MKKKIIWLIKCLSALSSIEEERLIQLVRVCVAENDLFNNIETTIELQVYYVIQYAHRNSYFYTSSSGS